MATTYEASTQFTIFLVFFFFFSKISVELVSESWITLNILFYLRNYHTYVLYTSYKLCKRYYRDQIFLNSKNENLFIKSYYFLINDTTRGLNSEKKFMKPNTLYIRKINFKNSFHHFIYLSLSLSFFSLPSLYPFSSLLPRLNLTPSPAATIFHL